MILILAFLFNIQRFDVIKPNKLKPTYMYKILNKTIAVQTGGRGGGSGNNMTPKTIPQLSGLIWGRGIRRTFVLVSGE